MVKVSLNNRSEISIKTCYEDCTLSDLAKIDAGIVYALTDCQKEVYEKLIPEYQDSIIILLDFVYDTDNLILPSPEKLIEVGDESFLKIERSKQIIGQGKDHYYTLPAICELYLGEDWIKANDRKVLKVFGQGIQIFESIKVFLDRHKDLQGEPETEDEQEAGVESIKSFGSFGLVYDMTDGKPWLFDTLLNCTAESVYMSMRYSSAKGRYEKNLLDIMRRRNVVPKNS